MTFLYLGLLLFSLSGLALLDWHRRLAFWADARRTAVLVLVSVVFFLVWDTVGIGLGIFARGDVDVMTGVELWPEMPLEEPVFLVLLVYVTLLVWRLVSTRGGEPRPLPGRARQPRAAGVDPGSPGERGDRGGSGDPGDPGLPGLRSAEGRRTSQADRPVPGSASR